MRLLRQAPALTLVALVALVAAACNTTPSGPNTAPSALVDDPPRAMAAPAWLVVSRGGVELGILELQPGRRGALSPLGDDPRFEELKKTWTDLDVPAGIAVDVHQPPKDGKGRGPLESQIVAPGSAGYDTIVRLELEDRRFDVSVVPRYHEDAAAAVGVLEVTRSGEAVGAIDFQTSPPVVTVRTEKADGLFLRDHWKEIAQKERLIVRYIESKNGTDTLVTLEAKPGDAAYPNLSRLYLVTRHQYDAEHGYALRVVPGVPAPAASSSAGPAATASAVAVGSGELPDGCMSAAQSMEYAKPHKSAAHPFEACAAGLAGHCDPKPGERGHLCSMSLDVAATVRARKTAPDVCCY